MYQQHYLGLRGTGLRGLFDGAAGWIGSATDYASGAAGTAATGGDIEDVPEFEAPETEDDLASAEFGEGMYASSDDGDMGDYGGASVGGALTPSLGEQADAVWSSTTIGETYDPDAGTGSSAAKDQGWQAGYNDGLAGKPHGASSKPPAAPYFASVYAQGYSEGYVEGTQDRLSGKVGGTGTKPAVGGGGSKPIVPDDSDAEPGMSNTTKLLLGLAAATAVGAVVVIARKKRRKAA
jgi:hypothetical protein